MGFEESVTLDELQAREQGGAGMSKDLSDGRSQGPFGKQVGLEPGVRGKLGSRGTMGE